MTRLSVKVLVALVTALAATSALACGYCVEDRIAAVYDHALSRQAQASGHVVAYFAWDGPAERSAAVRLKIQMLAQRTAGVDAGSVRVAVDPAAIAVAFDPRRTSAAAVGAALGKQLAPLQLSVIPLQAPSAPGNLASGG